MNLRAPALAMMLTDLYCTKFDGFLFLCGRGVQSKAAESAFSKFLYFYFYSTYHKLALKLASTGGSSSQLPYIVDVLIGYLAEGSHLPVTLPFEVIQRGTSKLERKTSKANKVLAVSHP